MTGLDLESFLLLLRVDLSTWVILGLATLGLVLLVWTCWNARFALRNCLVLSLAAHLGLVLCGSTVPAVIWAIGGDRRDAADRSHIRQIRVAALVEPGQGPGNASTYSSAGPRPADAQDVRSRATRWDLVTAPLELADAPLRVARPIVRDQAQPVESGEHKSAPPVEVGTVTPKSARHSVGSAPPEPRTEASLKPGGPGPALNEPLPPNLAELDRGLDSPGATSASETGEGGHARSEKPSRTGDLVIQTDRRIRPEGFGPIDPNRAASRVTIVPERATREPVPADTRIGHSPPPGTALSGQGDRSAGPITLNASAGMDGPIPLARATPKARSTPGGGSGLAALGERQGGQDLAEIPKFYQPRLDPDRSTRAQRIGASAASELAVERALDWLGRHQDDDGRWDGGIARYEDGTPVKNDDDFTVHCPAGETCFGACAYWEADTALTGLALLTYLGAGYTHTDGRYTEVVSKGLDFLIRQQKPDGDLRGGSRVVGMYCHAMATLALCEAYALTGDDRLRDATERAIAFLVRARARDLMAWRYAPGAPVGDTSILGWVVMGLKSAKEVGIPIPGEQSVRRGTLFWLDKVATGQAGGLARYQPWEPVTATMTAEAWVCRQFLGVGGPGPASTEAAGSLLENNSDRGSSNFYYWYYATLALYQHGGEPWSRWNTKIRDRIVGLQRSSGHQTGSWEPDDSPYGAKGGRIYCTTLAALTLEVYYRYLRLYDEPKIPLEAGATPPRQPGRGERPVPTTATSNVEDR
ncbi:MAG: hypothetical protein ACHRXM_10735 [Isosphaerales bacterium]